MKLRKLIAVIGFLGLLTPVVGLTKEITFFDQPAVNAKAIGKVELSKGIIPIYRPKTGAWIKVADPSNGNVGWINLKDLKAEPGSSVTFTEKWINDGKRPVMYQFFRYGNPSQLSDKEAQQKLLEMQKQYQAIQHSMQHTINTMMNDFNQLYREQWEIMNSFGFPSMTKPEAPSAAKQTARPSIKDGPPSQPQTNQKTGEKGLPQ